MYQQDRNDEELPFERQLASGMHGHTRDSLVDEASGELAHVGVIIGQISLDDSLTNPLPDLVVICGRAQRPKEVQWLPGKTVYQRAHILQADSIILCGIQQLSTRYAVQASASTPCQSGICPRKLCHQRSCA